MGPRRASRRQGPVSALCHRDHPRVPRRLDGSPCPADGAASGSPHFCKENRPLAGLACPAPPGRRGPHHQRLSHPRFRGWREMVEAGKVRAREAKSAASGWAPGAPHGAVQGSPGHSEKPVAWQRPLSIYRKGQKRPISMEEAWAKAATGTGCKWAPGTFGGQWKYSYNCPLLGIVPEKTMSRKDTCTPVFTAAVFTTAKTWKQPKCPSTEDGIKKMWCTHTMEYYLATKRNGILAFAATWMDLEITVPSEVRQ